MKDMNRKGFLFLEMKAVNEYLASFLARIFKPFFSSSFLDFRRFDSRRRCPFLSVKG